MRAEWHFLLRPRSGPVCRPGLQSLHERVQVLPVEAVNRPVEGANIRRGQRSMNLDMVPNPVRRKTGVRGSVLDGQVTLCGTADELLDFLKEGAKVLGSHLVMACSTARPRGQAVDLLEGAAECRKERSEQGSRSHRSRNWSVHN